MSGRGSFCEEAKYITCLTDSTASASAGVDRDQTEVQLQESIRKLERAVDWYDKFLKYMREDRVAELLREYKDACIPLHIADRINALVPLFREVSGNIDTADSKRRELRRKFDEATKQRNSFMDKDSRADVSLNDAARLTQLLADKKLEYGSTDVWRTLSGGNTTFREYAQAALLQRLAADGRGSDPVRVDDVFQRVVFDAAKFYAIYGAGSVGVVVVEFTASTVRNGTTVLSAYTLDDMYELDSRLSQAAVTLVQDAPDAVAITFGIRGATATATRGAATSKTAKTSTRGASTRTSTTTRTTRTTRT